MMADHQPRRYRRRVAAGDLVAFEVALAETDLLVLAERAMHEEARAAGRSARREVESHGALHAEFLRARRPLERPGNASGVVGAMYDAASVAGTGPMAAVAGAIAEAVARALSERGGDVVVENGGDVYMISGAERTVAIDAGDSPWRGRVALVLPPGEWSVCTSSGTVGHSESAGRADAAVVAARDGALADAVATATANRVREPGEAQAAVEWALALDGVEHVLVVCGGELATAGRLQLRRVASEEE